jgi:hypothetical protein
MTPSTIRSSRLTWGVGCLAAATVLALACSDSTAPTTSGKTPPPTPFVVSSPVPVTAPTVRDVLVSPGTSTVVYVSLPPGAMPKGRTATIRDPRLGSTVSAAFVNGGFDPVALPAAAGDNLVLSVLDSGATVPVSYTRMVPDGEPPIVVRTSPAPHKRDVPLNARIIVVFSQPIDSATLTPGSITLWRQATPVPGHLAFGDPLSLTVAFTPDSALSPLTDYQLTVTAADGAPLMTPVQVPFTTGTTSTVGQLAFVVQPDMSTTAGMAMAPAIQVMALNTAGVRDSTYTGPITMAIGTDAGGGRLSGGLQVAAVYGLATFPDLSIDKASTYGDSNGPTRYTLTATASGFAGATSSGFYVDAGVATRLALLWRPSNALVGLTMWTPVDVVALDAEGNDANGPTGNITVALGSNPGGGTLSGTTVAWVSSDATFQFRDLRIDRAGSGYTLVVTWGGLTATSTPFTVFQPSQLIAFSSAGTGLSFVDAVSGGLARAGESSGSSWPAWSPDGTKIALMGYPPAGEDFGPIEVANADGFGLVSLGQSGERPAWSPDGSRIAFGATGGIYVMNSDGTGVTQLGSLGSDPAWSPDGAMIAFSSNASGSGTPDIYVMKTDGTAVTRLTSGLGGMWPAWSPDGTQIAFSTSAAGIYVMNADGTSVTQVTATTGWAPSWSPDGTTLAFASPEESTAGISAIYLVSPDGTGLRPLLIFAVPADGSSGYAWASASMPAWRPAPHP